MSTPLRIWASARHAMVLALLLGISAGPSAAQISVVGGLIRETVLRPGGKAEGRLVLANHGDKDQQAKVYQTDYRFWCDGRTEYGEPGSTPRSNAKWLTVTPSQVTVPAHGSESVFYTLLVPPDDKLTGSYWSMVMVEPVAPESLEPPKPAAGQVGLRTVMRYGVQIATQIGDTGTRALQITDRQLAVGAAGQRDLQIALENTGERVQSPVLWAELFDANGALIGRFESAKQRVYPGCSVRHSVNLANVPKGHYKALVVADNGDDHVYGARYEMDLP